jgi:hypothetical protein
MTALEKTYEMMYEKDIVKVHHKAMGRNDGIVAEVVVDKYLSTEEKLEKAYMLTNSIHDAWWNNEEVTPLYTTEGCRSTMTGDVMEIGDETWIVAPVGFEKM